jgi:hypothetical protein
MIEFRMGFTIREIDTIRVALRMLRRKAEADRATGFDLGPLEALEAKLREVDGAPPPEGVYGVERWFDLKE